MQESAKMQFQQPDDPADLFADPRYIRDDDHDPERDRSKELEVINPYARECIGVIDEGGATPDDSRIPPPEPPEDYWTMPNSLILRRMHVVPRKFLYVPHHDTCPIPLKWLDIVRETNTDLDHAGLHKFEDYWTTELRDPHRKQLDEAFIGYTQFQLLEPEKENGKTNQHGRPTVVHKDTARPPNVYVEFWRTASRKEQEKAIAAWKIEGPKREQERRLANWTEYVHPIDVPEYKRRVPEIRQRLREPPAPAMPSVDLRTIQAISAAATTTSHGHEQETVRDTSHVLGCPSIPSSVLDSDGTPLLSSHSHDDKDLIATAFPAPDAKPVHHDNLESAGYVTAEYFALVHKAIDRDKYRRIPNAQQNK